MSDATLPANTPIPSSLHRYQASTPLRDSALWYLQSRYYASIGLKAWTEGIVPNFVTSNSFLAHSYAKIVLNYLIDWYQSPHANHSEPVYLFEIGSGHGKLMFLLLQELFKLWESWPILQSTSTDTSFSSSSSVSDHEHSEWEHVYQQNCNNNRSSSNNNTDTVSSSSTPTPTPSTTKHYFGTGPNKRRIPFKIILTDFYPETINFWQHHESLQFFIQNGALDMAVLDAEGDTPLDQLSTTTTIASSIPLLSSYNYNQFTPIDVRLHISGTVLNSRTMNNPSIMICNYIFDTLRQDAFRTVNGVVYEARTTLYTDRDEHQTDEEDIISSTDNSLSSSHDPNIISRLRVSWNYEPVNIEDTYPDPGIQNILRYYATKLPNCTFTIPIGGIRLLRRLSLLNQGKGGLLLAGDKSYAHEEELGTLTSSQDPHVAIHGSFSFMVNFHAVKLYLLTYGNYSLHTLYLDGFKCSAFMLHNPLPPGTLFLSNSSSSSSSLSSSSSSILYPVQLTFTELLEQASIVLHPQALTLYPNLYYIWSDIMETFGPDNFLTLQRSVRDEITEPSLKLAQSIIRMSNWDPDVFFKFKTLFIDHAPSLNERAQFDLYNDVRNIYERYYPLQPTRDIAFELARTCMGLKRYKEAISLFVASIRQCGHHHVTVHNMGISLYHLQQYKTAIACFDESLQLKPNYTDAMQWRTRSLNELDALETSKQSKGSYGNDGNNNRTVVVPVVLSNDTDTKNVEHNNNSIPNYQPTKTPPINTTTTENQRNHHHSHSHGGNHHHSHSHGGNHHHGDHDECSDEDEHHH